MEGTRARVRVQKTRRLLCVQGVGSLTLDSPVRGLTLPSFTLILGCHGQGFGHAQTSWGG